MKRDGLRLRGAADAERRKREQSQSETVCRRKGRPDKREHFFSSSGFGWWEAEVRSDAGAAARVAPNVERVGVRECRGSTAQESAVQQELR